MALRRLYLENFRSYAGPNWIDLAPLTVVVGDNGVGKSTVLDALEVLMATAASVNRLGFVVPPHLDWLRSEGAIHFRCDTTATLGLGVELAQDVASDAGGRSYVVQLDAAPAGRGEADLYQGRWRFTAAGGGHHVQWDSGAFDSGDGRALRVDDEAPLPATRLPARPFEAGNHLRVDGGGGSPALREGARWGLETIEATRRLLIERCAVLRSPRGASLMDATIGEVGASVGSFGESTLRMLARLYSSVDRRRRRDWIEACARDFGLGELTAGWDAGRSLRAQFVDPRNGAALPLAAAGGGSQQLLPFLVQAIGAERGSLIGVDEIEHGLHPAQLVRLAAALAELVGEDFGLQVLVTTQSPTLLLALCALIGEGHLRADQLRVVSVTRGDDGRAGAQTLKVEPDGSVEGGWLEHYAAAERELFARLLAVAARGERDPAVEGA